METNLEKQKRTAELMMECHIKAKSFCEKNKKVDYNTIYHFLINLKLFTPEQRLLKGLRRGKRSNR